MANQDGRDDSSIIDPATFIFVDCILGAVAGVIIGYWLDRPTVDSRVVALIAAFAAVAVAALFREYLSRFSPALSFRHHGKTIPRFVWMSIGLAAVIGALAGHDLCTLFGDTSGVIVGLVSGTLAAVSKATLTIFYFHEHPKRGLDF